MKRKETIGSRIPLLMRIDRALRLVWASSPGWTVVSAVLIVLQAVLPLLSLYLTKRIVDAADSVIAAKPIALARSLFKEAPICVLDEPTSNIDAKLNPSLSKRCVA